MVETAAELLVVLLVVLAEALVDEAVALLDALAGVAVLGAVGKKLLLPVPKPSAPASLPLP
jgi:hypothetical protein